MYFYYLTPQGRRYIIVTECEKERYRGTPAHINILRVLGRNTYMRIVLSFQ